MVSKVGGLPALQRSLLAKHGIRLRSPGPELVFDLAVDRGEDITVTNGAREPAAVAGLGLGFETTSAEAIEIAMPSGAVTLEAPRFTLRPHKPSSVWTPPADYKQEITVSPSSGSITVLRLAKSSDWKAVLRLTDGSIVAARRGRHLVFGFDYEFFLRSASTFPDLTVGYSSRQDNSKPELIEAFIVGQLTAHFERNGGAVDRLPHWPDGKRWCFSIRHDYDRLLTDDEMINLLTLYNERGIRSSWYFLDHKRISHQARLIVAMGHEVGLHSTAADQAEFLAQVDRLTVSLGAAPTGVTAHGGDYRGFLGNSQHHWAQTAGLLYSELLGFRHPYAYALPTRPAGDFYILPTHTSFDAGTKAGMHKRAACERGLARARKAGECFLLMNHPDVQQSDFTDFVRSIDLSEAWCATSAMIAQRARDQFREGNDND